MKTENLSYMDCWGFIAQLIPVTAGDDLVQKIYLMTFHALKEADERAKEEARKKWTD